MPSACLRAGPRIWRLELPRTLAGQRLPSGMVLKGGGTAGLEAVAAPWRFGLFKLRLAAEHLAYAGPAEAPAFFLVRVAGGSGLLRTEAGTMLLRPGDLVHGRLSRRFGLSCQEALYLQGAFFQHPASCARLATLPLPGGPALLPSAGLLGNVLRMAVKNLASVTLGVLPPLELSLLEFLTAEASASTASGKVLPGSMGRNAIALRAMQAIELHLSEPELSPPMVAGFIGISLRYLQKLFEEMGTAPTQYIRQRRLERIRQDLQNPLYAGQSIAEISLRWGFTDAAYCSRLFKAFYGLSPSAHRGGAKHSAGKNRRGGDFDQKFRPHHLAFQAEARG